MHPPTTTERRWLRYLGWTAATLAVLAGVCVLLLWGVVRSLEAGALKSQVERRVSAAIGGETTVAAVELGFRPTPRMSIRDAKIRVPGAIDLEFPRAEADLSLLGLLSGKLHLVKVTLDRPRLVVTTSQRDAPTPDVGTVYRDTVLAAIDAAGRRIGALAVQARGGTVDFVDGKGSLLALTNLDGEASLETDSLRAAVTASADLWRSAAATLHLDRSTGTSTLEVTIKGLDPARPLRSLLEGNSVQAQVAPIDGHIRATLDPSGALRGKAQLSTPQVTLTRGDRRLRTAPVLVDASGERQGEALVVDLARVDLGGLVQSLSGSLRLDPAKRTATFSARVPAVDVAPIREGALALAGDISPVRVTTEIVRVGSLSNVEARASADNARALLDPGNLHVEGRAEKASVSVPAIGIDFVNGSAAMVFDGGTLRVSELDAQTGGMHFSDGQLAIALVPAVRFDHGEGAFEADLARLLPEARRVLTAPNARAQLATIEHIEGTVRGHADARMADNGLALSLDASSVRARARLRDFPFPIEIASGALRYRGDRLEARSLRGRVGSSTVSDVTGVVALGPASVIRSASGRADLALDEDYGLLSPMSVTAKILGPVRKVTGRATVDVTRLSGPIRSLADLKFNATIEPRNVTVEADVLPGPLTIHDGRIAITPDRLELDRLDVALLDARATANGTVDDYKRATRKVRIKDARGTLDNRAVDALMGRLAIPPRFHLRAPIGFALSRLESTGDGLTGSGEGTLQLPGAVQSAFDLAWRPDALDLKRLTLKDAASDAVLGLKWSDTDRQASFSGRLHGATVAALVTGPIRSEGVAEGDLRAELNFDKPLQSTVVGKLDARALELPIGDGGSLVMERLRVEATPDRLTVHELLSVPGGPPLSFQGEITRQRDRFTVEGKLSTAGVDLEKLLLSVPKSRGRTPQRTSLASWPVDGHVAVEAGFVAFRGYRIEPLVGTFTLDRGKLTGEIAKAEICGLSAPLSATYAAGEVDVSIRLTARGTPLQQSVDCLTRGRLVATGTADLNAAFTARGPIDALVPSARGRFELVSRDGQIQSSLVVRRILALVALLNLAPASLATENVPYDAMTLSAALEERGLVIERATLDSRAIAMVMRGTVALPGEQLDLSGVVSPVGTLNRIVNAIPIIGCLFSTPIAAVPFGVRGTIDDPLVIPLQPTALLESVATDLGNLLSAPVRMIAPVIDRGRAPTDAGSRQ